MSPSHRTRRCSLRYSEMRVLGEVWKVVYRNDLQIKQLEPLRARHYDLSCLIDACRVENREETRPGCLNLRTNSWLGSAAPKRLDTLEGLFISPTLIHRRPVLRKRLDRSRDPHVSVANVSIAAPVQFRNQQAAPGAPNPVNPEVRRPRKQLQG